MASYKTLREALAHMLSDDGMHYVPEVYLDLRIVPPDALVALDVEAGAKALCELLTLTEVPRRAPWDDSNDAEYKQHFRNALTAILKACGVHVPDEVYTPDDGWGDGGSVPVPFDQNEDGRVYLNPGDTVTITRRKEGDK